MINSLMDMLKNIFTQEPNWVVMAILGLVLGHYAKHLLGPVERTVVRFLKPQSMTGNWYEYHWSTAKRQTVFRKEIWKITKQTLSGELRIEIREPGGSNLAYGGTMVREGNHWIKETKGINHGESTFSRLTSPIAPYDDTFVGICLSTDFDGRILASVQLLSRVELTDDQAKDLLKNAVILDQSHCAIRIAE
jgi:hypothetical protein